MRLKGKTKPGKFFHSLLFGGYNRQFKPVKTVNDWLTRDEHYNQSYQDDERSGFVCSLSFFYELFSNLSHIYRTSSLKNMNNELPIYFFSGNKDPLSFGGFTVKLLAKKYKKLGSTDVTVKLYPDGRHVMLNETNKEEVVLDLSHWLNQHLT